jgi:Mg-chelatase subunit ChlD
MNYEVNEITVHAKPVKCLKIIGNSIETRNPTHTIVLLDTSGSMDEGSKLTNVKKSLTFLLKFLQKTDYLSLVTFNTGSLILIENINITSDYMEAFRYTIDTLEAEGGTNLSAGLLNVKGILERTTHNTKTGLIILTDGHANEGLTRSDDLLRIIQSIKSLNSSISITTIGYNDDHNANILKEIAINGNGSYNIVNNIEQVATVFGDILGGLMTTVAQNVSVSYPSSWNNLNMYKKKDNGVISTLDIGDVCGESETILLFENTDANTVSVSGVDTKTFESIQSTITWTGPYNEYKDLYMMAYIRNSLAYILNHMKSMDKDLIKNLLNEMKEFLNKPLVQFNPLTKMLKEEISSIENQLNSASIDNTHNLQTSMMLGFGRGLSRNTAATIRRRPSIVNHEEFINNLNSMNVSTPFANRVQREITQQMCDMTQDPME